MKKASLLPAVIMGCMGIAFAAISILPNTSEFPQRPAGAGTIAGLFNSFFNSDGTAKNALTLSGSAAREYLQDNDCTNPVNNVWVGVDDNGKGKCGSLVNNLLGYITDYSGTTVTIKHTWDPWNSVTITDVGIPVYDGDAIETGGDSLVTVILKDNSAIRLNTGSLVDFTYVMSGSENIAQLILDHGEIWGRVMTSTGMNFGNRDWIAGVRGTALTMDYRNIGTELAPIWTGAIYVVDSTVSAGATAAVVESKYDSSVKTELTAGAKMEIKKPEQVFGTSFNRISESAGAFTNLSSAVAEMEDENNDLVSEGLIRKSSLMSPWIRENIKKDLVHLANLTNSGTVVPTIKAKAIAEFIASAPKTGDECTETFKEKIPKNRKHNKNELKSKRAKFIPVDTTLTSDATMCTDIVNTVNVTQKINKIACSLGGLQYFGEVEEGEYCEKKGLVAVAEFNQEASIATTLGMYRVDGYNLFHSQSSMDSLIAGGKYVPWFDTSNSPQFKDGNALGQPPNATKLTLLNANGLKFQSGSLEHGIFTMTNLDNAQGAMINNEGADSYIKYNLPVNINKIEIAVRGAALVRHHAGIKYYLFGIHDGYELYVYYDGTSHNKLKLVGFGKNIELTIPTGVMTDQSKLFTIVFKKDAGSDGTLSLLNNDGQLVSSGYSNPVTGDVGTTYSFLKGNQPYIYVGTDGDGANAINDIIDSVRLYNE